MTRRDSPDSIRPWVGLLGAALAAGSIGIGYFGAQAAGVPALRSPIRTEPAASEAATPIARPRRPGRASAAPAEVGRAWSHDSFAADPARGYHESLEPDPQLDQLAHSFPNAGGDGGVALPFPVTEIGARIVGARGNAPRAGGTLCMVRLIPATLGFSCAARVLCDGAEIYPAVGATTGYLDCEFDERRAVVGGEDTAAADLDGDGRFAFSLPNRTARAAHDGWEIELELVL